MGRIMLTMTVALVLAGCGSGSDTPASGPVASDQTTQQAIATTSPSATSAPSTVTTVAGCLSASPTFVARFTGTSAAAVKETVPTKPGLNRKGTVWFVSTKDGATWVTNIDPTADESGLIFPLNAKARAAAPEVGADVAPGALVLEGFTDASPGAVRSRVCAAS